MLTSFSFTCTFIIIKKQVKICLFLDKINIRCVFTFYQITTYYILLYNFFSLMTLYGLYAWKKELITK